jgi:hypothetical protein
MIRDKKKKRKIDSLKKVSSSPAHSLDKIFLSSRPVFYSGTPYRILPNPTPNANMLSAMEDLQVIDTISGFLIELMTCANRSSSMPPPSYYSQNQDLVCSSPPALSAMLASTSS